MMRTAVIVILIYAASYAAFRQSHAEIWSKDQAVYVIFPASGLESGLYYLWRPLAWIDAKTTGMRFHIGPHR